MLNRNDPTGKNVEKVLLQHQDNVPSNLKELKKNFSKNRKELKRKNIWNKLKRIERNWKWCWEDLTCFQYLWQCYTNAFVCSLCCLYCVIIVIVLFVWFFCYCVLFDCCICLTCFQHQRQCPFWAPEGTVCTHLNQSIMTLLMSVSVDVHVAIGNVLFSFCVICKSKFFVTVLKDIPPAEVSFEDDPPLLNLLRPI